MTAAERHARLTAIVIRLDQMASAFMQLDCEVRELLRAEVETGPAPRPAKTQDAAL